ncbi:hypothetical protein [Streptomyces montanisoli]|uniref:Uncharacterized protein n=1 Tax=Streptomyces montanisoli TaxID=2798581 RepID=A0A940RZ35_9ACTN|nr:hypothetical protein [Streptomyces montanisoli]MBP0459339.1 hypothetical protein [Streptomyces montanisoli]
MRPLPVMQAGVPAADLRASLLSVSVHGRDPQAGCATESATTRTAQSSGARPAALPRRRTGPSGWDPASAGRADRRSLETADIIVAHVRWEIACEIAVERPDDRLAPVTRPS